MIKRDLIELLSKLDDEGTVDFCVSSSEFDKARAKPTVAATNNEGLYLLRPTETVGVCEDGLTIVLES